MNIDRSRNGTPRTSVTAFFFLSILLLGLLLAACGRPAPTPTPQPPPTPSPTATPPPQTLVPTPRPILFPRDEAPHEDMLEWWYYNGHLKDKEGREYGFHFVIFQGRSSEGAIGYIAHMTVTDLDRSRHDQASRTSTGVQPQPVAGFAFDIQDWRLRGTPEEHAFQAATENYALNLTMTPLKPAALHDEDGFLVGPEGWTYYYSWTRMEAQGTLTLDSGEALRVSGSAWMDHQWGDFTVSGFPAGWQWFAVQLDDGTDLMVTESRSSTGATGLYGTLVDADGRTEHLPGEALSLEVLGQWTSPQTGAEYPAGWRLRVKSQDLEIGLQPVIADQEVTVAFPPNTIYWEGKVAVMAEHKGKPLGGVGFVELVGYVQVPGLTPPGR